EDLQASLEISVSQGELSGEEFAPTNEMLKKCLETIRERHWFDGTYKVYNELEIIEVGGKISRPDRVLLGAEAIVIDFKFGKKREQSHIRQVNRYISLIKSMGMAYVKGYLWYPEENDVVEVI
ncbi:MAG: Dna2/Cas4 domain-containing protein, partial [Bacteroidales bacterium]|nr:Dna2/Cas4 domain-containing protein [Bacteroidales bacterium]